jgi:hypothetical protein
MTTTPSVETVDPFQAVLESIDHLRKTLHDAGEFVASLTPAQLEEALDGLGAALREREA